MPSERQTEAVVRSHFAAHLDEVTLEEQESDSPRIAKLLRRASKSGHGPGRPDFIVRFHNEPCLLAVVECKANVSRHESAERNDFAGHAVDGALHYAEHLSKGFDVLAIAVSGTARRHRVSHFLRLQSEREPREIFGDGLLAPHEYIKGYRDDEGKYRQDFTALQRFIQELNDTLHIDKVTEGDRALLISAVLIALERSSFRNAYSREAQPQVLAKMTVDAAVESLRDAGVEKERLDVIKRAFGFLTVSPVLSTKPGELAEIIASIDENVNSFRKTHQYRDVLGTFYVEFLRHANSDKGLGIVLTPPHITEFFAELARVNAKSIVYDSCVGTGGFLISAMKRMIDDAKGDSTVERRIKHSQLYGVELQRGVVSDERIGTHIALRDTSTWGRFPLTDLFRVSGTTTTPPRELDYHQPGAHPYVTTQATNNGVGDFYDHFTEDGGVITVDSAVVGYCAYQAEAFSASDHVEKLTPRFSMTASAAMFLATILNREQYRYNYGLKRAQKRLRRESLRLPCTRRGVPDWRYIEKYIGGLRYSAI